MSSWVAGVAGALFGLGVFLAVAGLRGVRPAGPSRRRLDLSTEGRQELLFRLALAIALAATVLLSTGWVVAALLAGLLGAAAPTLFGGAAARRRELARIEAIAAWTEMLRDVSASGAGIQESVIATAPVAPEAIRDQVQALAVRLERDRLVPALHGFADELSDPMADLVAAALITAAGEQTRHFGELLGSLAQAIRDQAAMRLRVESGRTRTRATAKAVAGISLVSAAGFVGFDSGFLAPYDTALGQLVLLAIGSCFAGAFWMLGKMGRPAEHPRLLPVVGAELEGSAWS